MPLLAIHFALPSAAIALATAVTLPDPSRCVANSGVTAFPACEYFLDHFSTCSALATTDAQGYYNCYCNQQYFNAIWE